MITVKLMKFLKRLFCRKRQSGTDKSALAVNYIAIRLTSKGMLCFYRCTLPEEEASNACWEAVKKDSLKVALTNAADPNFVRVIMPPDDSALRCKTEFQGLNRTKLNGCELAHHKDTTWLWGKDSDVLRQVEKLMLEKSQEG